MPLNKLQNIRVRVVPVQNLYRPTSFKYHLMRWALSKEEFSKQEFFEALLEIKGEKEVQSKMSDEVLVRAWWNEFFTKSQVFKIVE